MEDSGIESDCKTGFLKKAYMPLPDGSEEFLNERETSPKEESESLNSSNNSEDFGAESVVYKGPFRVPKMKSSSILQKRLEKQMLQTRKFRQKEKNLELMPKKLIPRNRLKVPHSQVPLVTKADSHPLVSWESESDDEIDYHPISKGGPAKEISQQLIKDSYNLDISPDDEDLDLIPPKPVTQKCVCCSLNFMCILQ